MFQMLLKAAIAAAGRIPRLIPVAAADVLAPVGRVAGRLVGKGRRSRSRPRTPRAAPSGGIRGALTTGAGVVGGSVLVDAVLGDGSTGQVMVPEGGIRVARRRKSDLIQLSQLEVIKDILADPLYSFLLGYLAIELAQKQGFAGETSGSIAQVAMGGIAYAKAISPLVEKIGPAATEVSGPGLLGIPGVPII